MALLDDAGEHRGERLLRPDDVVAEAGDEGTGLGSGEEGDGLPEHVAEDLGAQVVDEPLPDPRGEPPLDERQHGAEDREAGHDESEPDHDRGVLGK